MKFLVRVEYENSAAGQISIAVTVSFEVSIILNFQIMSEQDGKQKGFFGILEACGLTTKDIRRDG